MFDLLVANYGVARGLNGEFAAKSFDDDTPYTPAWQERITGTPRAQLISVAREFAENAHKTQGRSMVIIGAAMNHWYHSDMNYRGVINMLMMCGCVGQERRRLGALRRSGKAAAANRLDCARVRARLDPPAAAAEQHQLFYAHTDQWRYEKIGVDEVLSPLADKNEYDGSMIDYNVRAERMGWLPSAPQLANQSASGRARCAGGRPRSEGLRGQGAEGRHAEDELHRPRSPRQLAAQHVRLALEHSWVQRQRPRIFSEAFARDE